MLRGYEVYQPIPGQFLFGDYKGSDVVLFEEFSWDRFRCNFPQLKRLLEGKSFAVDQKCNDSRVLKFDVPVVMVSQLEAYRGLKSCSSLLDVVSLRVPHRNVSDFSIFSVSPSNNRCPSARCAYAANAVGRDFDIFAVGVVSLGHILRACA
jgi:hypothetical protein